MNLIQLFLKMLVRGLVIMVHGEGLEPSQAYAHYALNVACLPFHHPCKILNSNNLISLSKY